MDHRCAHMQSFFCLQPAVHQVPKQWPCSPANIDSAFTRHLFFWGCVLFMLSTESVWLLERKAGTGTFKPFIAIDLDQCCIV